MSQITTEEKNLLESRPHSTKLWLSVYKPTTILACQVNDGGIERGERTITYDNATGDHTDVKYGMVMLVGSSAGESDKGKIRVRSADASEIVVAENSNIGWENDDHLTILNFFEINPVYPRIIQDPSDPENTLWYKDYDIEYTDQNSVLGSFICMGPHHAAFLDGGAVDVYYTASGTVNLKDEAMTYAWEFGGADTADSALHTPGNISYSSVGHYTTSLTVTTGGGASDVSYRHISIYDRPEDGTDTPILKWELKEMSGDRTQGGWSASVTVRQDTSDVHDGALVVIFQESVYGSSSQNIGGNATGRQGILYTGYILDGTIEYNYQDETVSFDIGSPSIIMKDMDCPAISVTSSTDPAGQAASDENYPSAWALVLELDIKRAMYHYLRWHSTALLCNDFEFIGTDQYVRHFESDRTSMYDAVNSEIQEKLVGNFVCGRQGKMFAEIDVSAINNAATTVATNQLGINKKNWIGTPSIDEKQIDTNSYLEMGGIQYNGASLDTYSALLAESPGSSPGSRGRYEKGNASLALEDQDQLNALCGNVFASRNSRYPSSDYRMAGAYLNFDIAPQELVDITLNADDTPKGISFSSKKFVPKRMQLSYNHRDQVLLPTMTFSEITQGHDASTIEIPDVPPTDPVDPGGGGVDQPPITVPPLPNPIWPTAFGKAFAARYTGITGTSTEHTFEIQDTFSNTTDIYQSDVNTIKAAQSGIYMVNTIVSAIGPGVGFFVDVTIAAPLYPVPFENESDRYIYREFESVDSPSGTSSAYGSTSITYPAFVNAGNVVCNNILSKVKVNPSAVCTLGCQTVILKVLEDQVCTFLQEGSGG